MYRQKKVLELSHYFCALRYLFLFSFPYSRSQANCELESLVIGFAGVTFVLGPYSPQFKDASKMVVVICERTDHFLFSKNPVNCLVWESSQFQECSCLLTEDPQSETPSQDQCLCQRACKHLHTVHPTGSAQCGFRAPQKLRRTFSLENTVCIYFCTFEVHPNPLPLPSRYN